MNNILSTLAAAVLVGMTAAAPAAMTEAPIDTREQIAKSDLVFLGTVSEISYAFSEGDTGIPHTYVTYDVERVIQGNTNDKQVILRFIGGRGKEADFLLVSGMPLFDEGDRDVLMVANNGVSGCPLVHCADGRLRIINGKVFTEGGQALERNALGQLDKADYYKLPEVMTHKVSMTTLRRVDQLDAGESRQTFVAPGQGAHIGETELLSQIADEARAVGRATPAQFKSADASRTFKISFDPSAPVTRGHTSPETRVAKTDQEVAELAALARSGGNPVIGKYDKHAKDSAK